ncbi:hypothetical protein ACSFA8_20675 [Variovorax sp. RT4R15]|uniref:hypothetical protein n=1 Tax=Variovorax sp. RT4R15 TaxID=3443737 RepID=UPI003F48CE71
MKVSILSKVLLHDQLGRLKQGDTAELPDKLAEQWRAKGWVEPYDTKVIRERPSVPAGDKQSASQAGQASPEQTPKPSKRGGRPKKAGA